MSSTVESDENNNSIWENSDLGTEETATEDLEGDDPFIVSHSKSYDQYSSASSRKRAGATRNRSPLGKVVFSEYIQDEEETENNENNSKVNKVSKTGKNIYSI